MMGRRKKPAEVIEFERQAGKYLGRRLREWRKKARLSTYDVAKLSGLSHSTVSDYERGKYLPPQHTIRLLAQIYNAPLSDFLIDDNPLEEDAIQIAKLLREWPEEDRSEITLAVLHYIESIRTIRPPNRSIDAD
jgi:transcriptional regulator with XRE-family HTH domain